MMRSPIHVSARRFALSMFPGFFDTYPSHEEAAATAGRIASLIAPDDGPMIVAEKDWALYFVPCALRDAPLTGKTLETAVAKGLPTVGRMRSGAHVTAGAWAKLDGDGMTAEQFAAARGKLDIAGIAHLIYSSHSHGSADKPGIRCRVIVFFDNALEPAEYPRAVLSLTTWLFGQSLDESDQRLCQQAGVWATNRARVEQAFCIRQLDGVCVSADALLAAAPPAKLRVMSPGTAAGPMPLDAARINEALNWINPTEYKAWTDPAFWLKAAYGDAAFSSWQAWGERADQDAQAGNEGRYAPETIWAGITPRLTAEQAAGALYARARDGAEAAARQAAARGEWAGQGKAALVYLKRFHARLYDELFGVST